MSESNQDPAQAEEAAAERVLFEPKDFSIKIGDRTIPVLPLNLHGAKAVLTLVGKIIGPLRAGYREYDEVRQRYYEARANDKAASMPPETWWLPLVLQNLDDVYGVLFVVLQRGDPSLTLSFLQENMGTVRDLTLLWPMLIEANDIGTILKKVLESEMGKALTRYGISRLRSDSQVSPETSPGITESPSTTLPDETRDTPSPSASSSETQSRDTLDS
jgi:hypothetical protein